MTHDDVFVTLRPLLFTIAYEIVGTASDAEDVVQDSYVRWSRATKSSIRDPRAYLVRLVTRQALNQLRTVKRRREDYIGPWLPEPIRTTADQEDVGLADSVSIAMMLILETLSPSERAVFVLYEVFGYSQAEVADMVGKTESAVRQIAHRAREHVQARRRRFQPDSDSAREVVRRFLAAARNGDVQALMDMMSPDVVQISDGGGRVIAARKPVHGPERVAGFIVGVAHGGMYGMRGELATYNALPGVLFYGESGPDTVLVFELADGLVHGLYAVRNPDKVNAARTVRSVARR